MTDQVKPTGTPDVWIRFNLSGPGADGMVMIERFGTTIVSTFTATDAEPTVRVDDHADCGNGGEGCFRVAVRDTTQQIAQGCALVLAHTGALITVAVETSEDDTMDAEPVAVLAIRPAAPQGWDMIAADYVV